MDDPIAPTGASDGRPAAEAAEAASTARVDDDIIRWPDEPPPPPEMWAIPPVHDWETEDRGFVFESRLEDGEGHKAKGNEHFRAEEWELALRRFKRAIYCSHFDELQMYDLNDHHKEAAYDIQVAPCKLSLRRGGAVRRREDGAQPTPHATPRPRCRASSTWPHASSR